MGAIDNEVISPWQKIMDNDFLLLAFHVGWSALSYLVWGFIELMNVPTIN
ncbi:MAG: hypothetical protein HQM11_12885 [SAR324 cluster bacterium]|nr:hypothetical protein [SAR324 cluster bacterium]